MRRCQELAIALSFIVGMFKEPFSRTSAKMEAFSCNMNNASRTASTSRIAALTKRLQLISDSIRKTYGSAFNFVVRKGCFVCRGSYR
jgi:hypothetical protein